MRSIISDFIIDLFYTAADKLIFIRIFKDFIFDIQSLNLFPELEVL